MLKNENCTCKAVVFIAKYANLCHSSCRRRRRGCLSSLITAVDSRCRQMVKRDLQIRLQLRVRVRVFQFVPSAHARLREAVTSTRSLVKLDANYEIFNKSRAPSTSSLQVQRRVKRLVFKGADTL